MARQNYVRKYKLSLGPIESSPHAFPTKRLVSRIALICLEARLIQTRAVRFTLVGQVTRQILIRMGRLILISRPRHCANASVGDGTLSRGYVCKQSSRSP